MDGNTLAEAIVTYLKLPLSKIATSTNAYEDVNIYLPDDVTEID